MHLNFKIFQNAARNYTALLSTTLGPVKYHISEEDDFIDNIKDDQIGSDENFNNGGEIDLLKNHQMSHDNLGDKYVENKDNLIDKSTPPSSNWKNWRYSGISYEDRKRKAKRTTTTTTTTTTATTQNSVDIDDDQINTWPSWDFSNHNNAVEVNKGDGSNDYSDEKEMIDKDSSIQVITVATASPKISFTPTPLDYYPSSHEPIKYSPGPNDYSQSTQSPQVFPKSTPTPQIHHQGTPTPSGYAMSTPASMVHMLSTHTPLEYTHVPDGWRLHTPPYNNPQVNLFSARGVKLQHYYFSSHNTLAFTE